MEKCSLNFETICGGQRHVVRDITGGCGGRGAAQARGFAYSKISTRAVGPGGTGLMGDYLHTCDTCWKLVKHVILWRHLSNQR